jgi:activating signal cointegrator complex subunit 2
MDEVPGIPGGVPPLALYPTPAVAARLRTAPVEWDGFLDSWLFSLEFRLRLTENDFQQFKLSQSASATEFLLSFLQSSSEPSLATSQSQKERLLFKRTYLLLKRLLLVASVPFDYGTDKLLHLLELASITFASVTDWRDTLKSLWARDSKQLLLGIEEAKRHVSSGFASNLQSDIFARGFHRLTALVKVSSEVGAVLMTGSDYFEALMEAYNQSYALSPDHPFLKTLTEHLFFCLRSIMSDGSPNGSLLLDHLYLLKSSAKTTRPSLCSSLVCTTSFLRHLSSEEKIAFGKRGQGLLEFLTQFRQSVKHMHPLPPPRRKKVLKGKAKADPHEEMHVHRAAQVSAVHDLFPDLPNHYILRLLDHFKDDNEAVIAALLEPDSLPADLRNPGSVGNMADVAGPAHDLAPRSTPPLLPQRRNVFDGDDFDKLHISVDRLHRGRKEVRLEQTETADQHTQRKAAIISALAAFDSDDDERDDTYDVADVGGTIDSTMDTDTRPRPDRHPEQNPREETLFRAWRDNQEFFNRDSKTRISKVRQDLKRDTRMSDEQIEGWAIMLKKDPQLQDRLERKYAGAHHHRGNQTALASTKWQEDNTPEDSEDGEGGGGSGRRVGLAQIRGSRNWGSRGRGRGGSTAGPSDDAATQAARRRKEQGRGRGGANHNRREGRARKMGRGMAGAVQQ